MRFCYEKICRSAVIRNNNFITLRLLGAGKFARIKRDGRRSRAEKIISAWDDILALAAALPAYEDMANFMRQLGMPTKPEEIGVGMQEVLDAFICSRDIRDKYILTSMIWDIGYMEECSKWLEAELGTLL